MSGYSKKRFLCLRAYLISFIALFLCAGSAVTEPVRVAVATNFKSCMKQIVARYRQASPHRIELISASTGKLYAQIKNGAPYDVFFAADKHRPSLLEKAGMGFGRFTYALGSIVLWNSKPGSATDYADAIRRKDYRFLALANPKLAPYGAAAKQTLQRLGLWEELTPKLVRGENIGQVFQFISSGNAELGFIALSQTKQLNTMNKGVYWEIPSDYYEPIEQQVVGLNNKPVVRKFLAFIKQDETKRIIRNCGFDALAE